MEKLLESVLSQTERLERGHVLEDFENRINDWCEMTSSDRNIPKTEMCVLAIETFGDAMSGAKIRYLIRPEFKKETLARVGNQNNALTKKEKLSRLRRIAIKAKKEIEDIVNSSTDPMLQASKYLEDRK